MSILLLGRLHCTSFTVETNLAIYILWSAFQKYGNKVNCQKKKMLDYEEPQVQFNTVKRRLQRFPQEILFAGILNGSMKLNPAAKYI